MATPAQLQQLWTFLESEVIWLHGRWQIYRQIFGTNSKRIDIINEIARTFFGVLQRVLMNDVQLTLMKFADPPPTFGKDNATLEHLITQVEQVPQPALANDLRACLVQYRAMCSKIKARRNKDLAHFDLRTQLSDKAVSLPNPSRAEIEEALAELRKFMNIFRVHFEGSQMAYEHFAMQDDANTLMYALKESLRYRALQADGSIPLEDILNSPNVDA
jgi:DNA-directed RNA polymerase subunit L